MDIGKIHKFLLEQSLKMCASKRLSPGWTLKYDYGGIKLSEERDLQSTVMKREGVLDSGTSLNSGFITLGKVCTFPGSQQAHT